MKRDAGAADRALQALLTCPTLDAAAQQAGVCRTQLWKLRRDPDFSEKLAAAQREAFRDCTGRLQQASETAVDTLVEIAAHGKNEQSRLAAARTILDQAARLTEIIDIDRRLQALEMGENDDP